MADLGPTFPRITQTIDMTRGDVNMWQVFGTVEDELAAFPRQMTKILLMAEQAYKATDEDRSIIRGSLEQIATRFYVYSNMWVEDAKKHRDEIRLVGLPNDQYRCSTPSRPTSTRPTRPPSRTARRTPSRSTP